MNKLLISTFGTETSAYEGLSALKELHRDGDITLYATSVIAKDPQGKVAIREAADSGPVGTLVGLVTGGLIGLLGGPAGVAVGAYVGGVGGLMYDMFNIGMSADFIDDVAGSLTPGKVAVVADIDETWVTPVDTRLGALGGTTFRRYPGDVVDEELARETEAASKELDQLDAELRQSSGEARANIEKKIAEQRAKLDALVARIEKTLADRKAELEAKLSTLRAQHEQARDRQREQIEARIDELKASYEVRKEKLEKARQLAKQSAEMTREALVS
jgi:uncharacterized membrane protein